MSGTISDVAAYTNFHIQIRIYFKKIGENVVSID